MTKEQFDVLYVQPKLAVQCEEEWYAKEFLSLARKFGYTWYNDEPYEDNKLYWGIGQNETCYCIYEGEFADVDYFEQYDYTIRKYIPLSDVKVGDKVKIHRDLKESREGATVVDSMLGYAGRVFEVERVYFNDKYGFCYDLVDNIYQWTADMFEKVSEKAPKQGISVNYGLVNTDETCVLCGGHLTKKEEYRTEIQINETKIHFCEICRDIFIKDILNAKLTGLDV